MFSPIAKPLAGLVILLAVPLTPAPALAQTPWDVRLRQQWYPRCLAATRGTACARPAYGIGPAGVGTLYHPGYVSVPYYFMVYPAAIGWPPATNWGSLDFSNSAGITDRERCRTAGAACREPYEATTCATARDGVDAYFQRRLANIEQRYTIRPALIRARLARDKEIADIKREYADTIEENQERAVRLARASAPQKLAAYEYDPIDGGIRWPAFFREDPRLIEERRRVDALFARRTPGEADPTTADSAEIRKTIDQMKNTLLAMLRGGQVDGTTYAVAKNFLRSLAYKTQVPDGPLPTSIASK